MKKNILINFFCLCFFYIILLTLFIDDLTGILSLSFVILVTLIIIKFHPPVGSILFVSLVIRVFVIFLGNIFTLPDYGSDTIAFEHEAFLMSKEGFSKTLSYYPGPTSSFIVWLVAILYSLFGRSLLMAQSLSLFFGIGSVFLGWLLAKKIWGDDIAKKAGWVLALFPTLVLYSALLLREVYCVFFLLVAIFGVFNWVRTGELKSILLALFGFISATFFHGGMIVGGIVFLLVVGLKYIKHFFILLLSNRISLKNLLIVTLVLFISIIYASNKIKIPKLGTLEQSLSIDRLVKHTNITTRSDASYPEWTKINSVSELIYKAPIRVIYFLFSPFPWDIKKLSHLAGSLDSILYMTLIFLILRSRKVIWEDPALRFILIILISYFFVFGIGVGNFGTGIRHRSKFVIGLILLAAPYIPKLRLSKK